MMCFCLNYRFLWQCCSGISPRPARDIVLHKRSTHKVEAIASPKSTLFIDGDHRRVADIIKRLDNPPIVLLDKLYGQAFEGLGDALPSILGQNARHFDESIPFVQANLRHANPLIAVHSQIDAVVGARFAGQLTLNVGVKIHKGLRFSARNCGG